MWRTRRAAIYSRIGQNILWRAIAKRIGLRQAVNNIAAIDFPEAARNWNCLLISARILSPGAFCPEEQGFMLDENICQRKAQFEMDRPVEPVDKPSGQFLQSMIAGTEAGSTVSTRRKPQLRSPVDLAKQRVAAARLAADSSLLRAKAAPRPHEITNPAFVALFEAHQRDREMLFEAMRALERVQNGSVSHAR